MDFNQVVNRRETYCTQWDYVADRFGTADLLPFTISDTDFPVPEPVHHALLKRIEHPIYGYTRWNHSDFKSSILNWYMCRFDMKLDEEWVVYSPSVMYSVSQLIDLYSKKGDKVIVQTPAYDAFYKTIEGNQRLVEKNPLIYKGNHYSLDFEHLEKLLQDPKSKILLFCSPHNPTGRIWSFEDLNRVYQLCRQYNVFIISDEIHMDVVRKGRRHIPLLNIGTEGIAMVSSGSKTFNFPGLIFSYMIFPDKKGRERYLYHLKNKDGLSSASTLGLTATMAAYTYCMNWVDDLNQYIDNNIEYVIQRLQSELPLIEVVYPESTYLMWLDVSNLNMSMSEIQKKLVDIGKVAIMSGEVYGGNGDQFLRLNVGCPRQKLIDGLDRMIYALSD